MSEKNTESSNTGSDSDQDFDPTADMLVNDFDDEHTLAEEEALEEDNSDELDDLQREGEMPLEELLALYGNLPDPNQQQSTNDDNDDGEEEEEKPDDQVTSESTSTSQLDTNDKLIEPKFTDKIDPLPVSSNLSRLISTNDDAFYEISDGEEDEDDTPEDWRRSIQIGQDYQAAIPDTVKSDLQQQSEVIDSSTTGLECLLLWNPKELDEQDVEHYLKSYLNNFKQQQVNSTTELRSAAAKQNLNNEISSSTNDYSQRDDELALYVLLKNSYCIDSALDKKSKLDNELIDLFTFIKPWSEEDCQLFEDGLRVHGKDFHQIQKNKLPHKTVNELVNFYYLWKKTERHDMFASKFKFEKRKYSLNPTITDLMDHFLDDNQSQQTSFNSTSSSLNSSLNNTISHGKHHSLHLLPTSNHHTAPNHLSIATTTTNVDNQTNNQVMTVADKCNSLPTTTTSSNDLTSTVASTNNVESTMEENSNPSSDGQVSKLVINEVTHEDQSNSNEFISSSSIKTSSDLSNECPITSTLANSDLSATTTTNTSEL